MAKASSAVEMTVTELRRTGEGALEDTPVIFKFSGSDHSSAQDDVDLHLKATTSRKEIPGSNKVVEHIMSATWQPFDLHGEWDDKWGNRRSPSLAGGITRTGSYAFSMYQEFATMVARTPMVRLEVDALSMVGILTDLYITYKTQTRIGWKVTLSPHQNENLTVTARGRNIKTQSIPKWVEDTKTQGAVLLAAFSKLKTFAIKTPHVDAFSKVMFEIVDALDRLQSIGLSDFTQNTTNKLLLMATTFRRLRSACLTGFDVFKTVSSAISSFPDILKTISIAEWIGSTLTDLWRTVGISRQGEIDMQTRAGRNPRAIYRPMAGESLERISVKFYGSPAPWRTIYDANNLSSLILTGNEELIIPERRT